jgi:hypothetical protein
MNLQQHVALHGNFPQEGDRRFTNADSRPYQMLTAVSEWYDALAHNLSTPMGNAQLDDWLRMQARMPYASARNTILLAAQKPDATELRTFEGWTENNDCSIKSDESAIWLWDPIVARQCPECGRGHFDHDSADSRTDTVDCTDVDPSGWDRAVVKYTPRALFDRSQIAGLWGATEDSTPPRINPPIVGPDEYQPDLSEDSDPAPIPAQLPDVLSPEDILAALPDVAEALSFSFTHVPPENWDRIELVVDSGRDLYTMEPAVKALDEGDPAERLPRLLEAFAYMELGYEVTETTEIRKRSKEAKAAAYATAIALGHGTQFTLPDFTTRLTFEKWADDDTDTLEARLTRIQTTVATLLDAFINARP